MTANVHERRVVVLGDSNVAAIAAWWNQLQRRFPVAAVSVGVKQFTDPRDQSFDFTFVRHDGKVVLHPWIKDNFAEAGLALGGDSRAEELPWVVLQLGAPLLYDRLLLHWSDEDFTVHHPFGGGERLAGRLVAHEVVAKRARRDFEPIFRGLEILRRWTDRLAVLHAPPPHRENSTLEATLARLVDVRRGCPPPTVRLKVQWVYHTVLRDFCTEVGVPFHDTWELTAAPDGFLDERFAFDGFHGNVRYAGLVLTSFYNQIVRPDSARTLLYSTPGLTPAEELELARLAFGLENAPTGSSSEDGTLDVRAERPPTAEELQLKQRIERLLDTVRAKDAIIAFQKDWRDSRSQRVALDE